MLTRDEKGRDTQHFPPNETNRWRPNKHPPSACIAAHSAKSRGANRHSDITRHIHPRNTSPTEQRHLGFHVFFLFPRAKQQGNDEHAITSPSLAAKPSSRPPTQLLRVLQAQAREQAPARNTAAAAAAQHLCYNTIRYESSPWRSCQKRHGHKHHSATTTNNGRLFMP